MGVCQEGIQQPGDLYDDRKEDAAVQLPGAMESEIDGCGVLVLVHLGVHRQFVIARLGVASASVSSDFHFVDKLYHGDCE